MDFFPVLTETLVLTMDGAALEGKIRTALEDQVLIGTLADQQFNVNVRVIRPTPFVPRMKGLIENTSGGSILFLRYHLFPATKLYLGFWSSALALAGVGAAYAQQNSLYVLAGAAMVVVVRWIAHENLKLQQVVSRKIMLEVLNA